MRKFRFGIWKFRYKKFGFRVIQIWILFGNLDSQIIQILNGENGFFGLLIQIALHWLLILDAGLNSLIQKKIRSAKIWIQVQFVNLDLQKIRFVKSGFKTIWIIFWILYRHLICILFFKNLFIWISKYRITMSRIAQIPTKGTKAIRERKPPKIEKYTYTLKQNNF